MEKRSEKRMPHCIELMYGGNDTFCPGKTLNVSCHGMHIHADSQIVPIDHEIKLVLSLDQEVVSMCGVVCWNSEVLGFEPEADKHLGVFIAAPPPGYLRFVDCLN